VQVSGYLWRLTVSGEVVGGGWEMLGKMRTPLSFGPLVPGVAVCFSLQAVRVKVGLGCAAGARRVRAGVIVGEVCSRDDDDRLFINLDESMVYEAV
jgi:hypothetical protein